MLDGAGQHRHANSIDCQTSVYSEERYLFLCYCTMQAVKHMISSAARNNTPSPRAVICCASTSLFVLQRLPNPDLSQQIRCTPAVASLDPSVGDGGCRDQASQLYMYSCQDTVAVVAPCCT